MKKSNIKKRRKILRIALFIIAFLFSIPYLIFLYVIITSTTHNTYKYNWKIDIPNPQKIEYILEDDRHTTFQIMHYNSKNIEKLKNREFMKKINEVNLISLNTDYETLIEKFYTRFLEKEEKELLLSKKFKSKFKDSNYYTLIEINPRYSNYYKFLFLLLDTEENILYSLSYSEYVR